MFFLLADLSESSIQNFITYVKEKKSQWKIPGTIFIGIIYNNQEKTYLIGDPLSEKTLLPIASLSKTMTAHLIGALVKKGVLHLNDPVSQYIPDLKWPHKKEIRIIDILTHQTGIGSFSGDSLLKLGFNDSEIKKKFPFFHIHSNDKTTYTYNNLPMGLLETVIEKATHKSFDQVAKELLFDPLKMSSACYDALKEKKGILSSCTRNQKNLSPLYIYENEDQYVKIFPNPNMAFFRASMGVVLTYPDLLKWLRYLMHPEQYNIVSSEFQKAVRTSYTSFYPKEYDVQFFKERRVGPVHYGINLFHMMYDAHQYYFHMGAWIGMRSYIAFDPKENFGIVIWHNLGSNDISLLPEAIDARFLDMTYDLQQKDWISEMMTGKIRYRSRIRNDYLSLLPSPSLPYAELCGHFHNDYYGDIDILQQSSNLYMQYRNKKIKLIHQDGNRFSFDPKEFHQYFDHGLPHWVIFSYNKDHKLVLRNSLMLEGREPLFIRR